MKKSIITFTIVLIGIIGCNKILLNDEFRSTEIYLGNEHNNVLEYNYNSLNYFNSIDYSEFYDKSINNTISYIKTKKRLTLQDEKEIINNIDELVSNYFVIDGQYIFDEKKSTLINDLRKFYNEEEMKYLLIVDELISKSNSFKYTFNEIDKIIIDINNSETLNQTQKEKILNIISIVPNSLNYWGQNLTDWQSNIESSKLLHSSTNKNIPDINIPPLPNCPPGYCWQTGTWVQETHAVMEADFWGGAATVAYTWWSQGTPVGWGTAVGGAAASSLTYVVVWVLKGGTGCQPCGGGGIMNGGK